MQLMGRLKYDTIQGVVLCIVMLPFPYVSRNAELAGKDAYICVVYMPFDRNNK